ncbi:phosphatase PAP2 family protein [Microbacterium sp. 18062]|uniref:phosphatase PAP2 family protein n=1 Tax=Microbacterium sp. 18062 TaxID=2681410 RepID=UPI00135BBCFB|nr:phosphatase PAP2 family protein [Microbacterium sp. 18062]
MTESTASGPSALVRGTIGATLLVLSAALGAWILARGNEPFAIDSAWNLLLVQADWAPFDVVSRFTNVAGGVWVSTIVVPAAGIVVLLSLRRPWSAGYFVLAVALSAFVVQILKHLFGRARPEQILVVSDYGSYPSGHVANAATLAAVLVVLLPRAWTAVVASAWVLIMVFSRTYLHAHWLSDTLGGMLVGVGVALVCAAFLRDRIDRERAVRPGHTSREENRPG